MADYTLPPPGDLGDGSSANLPGSAGSSSTANPTDGAKAAAKGGRRKRRRSFVRRHWVLLSLAVVFTLIAGTAGGYYYLARHKLDAVPRVGCEACKTVNNGAGGTTKDTSSESNRAINILLMGADGGSNPDSSVADELKDGKWTPGSHRSDTMMVMHIPADRKSVQLVSIPRDSWVPIPGYGTQKINAAFSYGGPDLAVQTVRDLTGISIDHIAIIDWAGFKDLTSAIGGVRIYIPETFYDDSQKITWEKGWHTLEGKEALAYVRTRHGLINGDFDRIARQQNFLRATMGKLLSKTHDPIALQKVLGGLAGYLTIDDGWSTGDIIHLALSLRSIKTDDVTFLTAPLGAYGTSTDGQSYVKLAPRQSQRLFDDLKNDDIQDYLNKYPDAALDNDKNVN